MNKRSFRFIFRRKMSRQSSMLIENPFVLLYPLNGVSTTSTFNSLSEIRKIISSLVETEYIAIIPDLISAKNGAVGFAGITIEQVIALGPNESKKLHDDVTGELNGGMSEVTINELHYIKNTMHQDILYSGVFPGDDLLGSFTSVVSGTPQEEDQTLFTTLYEYVLANLAIWMLLSKKLNEYLYVYMLGQFPGFFSEIPEGNAQFLLPYMEPAQSISSIWRKFLEGFVVSFPMCSELSTLAKYVVYSSGILISSGMNFFKQGGLCLSETETKKMNNDIEYFTTVGIANRNVINASISLQESSDMKSLMEYVSTTAERLDKFVGCPKRTTTRATARIARDEEDIYAILYVLEDAIIHIYQSLRLAPMN